MTWFEKVWKFLFHEIFISARYRLYTVYMYIDIMFKKDGI